EERIGLLYGLAGGDDLHDARRAAPIDLVDRETPGGRGRRRTLGNCLDNGRARLLAQVTEDGDPTERRAPAKESGDGERGDRYEVWTGHAGGLLLCPHRYTHTAVSPGLRAVKPSLFLRGGTHGSPTQDQTGASASGTVVTVCSRSAPSASSSLRRSSPLACSSSVMSAPPINSPLTKTWGIVGQPEISAISCRIRGSARMSTAAIGAPASRRARSARSEFPHITSCGLPFMKSATGSLSMTS